MSEDRVKYICDNCDGGNECVARAVAGQYPVLSNLHCVYDTGGSGHWRKAEPDPVRERAERVRGMDAEIEGDRQPDSPPYYARDGVQCWDAIYATHGAPGCLSHILKYAWRAGHKPGVSLRTDLIKARNWIEFLLTKIGGDE